MKLEQLIKPLRDRTDEELHEMIRQARLNKSKVKPIVLQIEKKKSERTSVNALTALSKKVDKLSPEEMQALIAQLSADLSDNKE